MIRFVMVASLVVVAFLAAQPALAQGGQMETRGTVTDHEGNPLQGVIVVYTAESNPALEYTGKTNKKGRYYIPGLFTAKEGDMWAIRVDAAAVGNMVLISMHVESRTANRTLIAPARTVKLGPRKKVPSIVIRPLGEAQVDFELAPPEMVAELLGVAAVPDGEQQQAAAQPQLDPYDQALQLAGDGDLESAIPFFVKAVEKKPEDAERHRAYAQVLYKLEYFDQAEVEAQAALALDDQDISAHMVLYSVYVGQGDLEAAGSAIAAAQAIDPNNIDLLRQVAYVASQGGDSAERIAAHEAIVAARPTETSSWLSLGDLYARSGQMDQSGAAYQKVVELDPKNADQVFYNLGALLMNDSNRTTADVQKAIGAFKKAVELNPTYAQAYKELGLALLNTGDRDGAKTALQSYVDHQPDAPDASQMKALIKALG